MTIADQHLRPRGHAAGCVNECVHGCPVRGYEALLAEPVLPSEIQTERKQMERLEALAAAANAA